MQRLARQDFAGSIEAFEALLAQRRTPARLCNLAAAELGECRPNCPLRCMRWCRYRELQGLRLAGTDVMSNGCGLYVLWGDDNAQDWS